MSTPSEVQRLATEVLDVAVDYCDSLTFTDWQTNTIRLQNAARKYGAAERRARNAAYETIPAPGMDAEEGVAR